MFFSDTVTMHKKLSYCFGNCI